MYINSEKTLICLYYFVPFIPFTGTFPMFCGRTCIRFQDAAWNLLGVLHDARMMGKVGALLKTLGSIFTISFSCTFTSQDPYLRPEALSWGTALRLWESTLCLHICKSSKHLRIYASSSLSLTLNQGLQCLILGGTSWCNLYSTIALQDSFLLW